MALREHLGKPFRLLGSTLGSHFGEVANNKILVDSGVVSGLVCVSFWGSKCVKKCLIFRLGSKSFLKNRSFRMDGIAKIDFSWKSFLVIFGKDF